MNEKTREELIRRSVALDALSKHPAYPELVAEVERRKERDLKLLIADYVTMGNPVDQRQIDYTRGWWEALEWAVKVPGKATPTLEHALKEAEKVERRKGAKQEQEV